MESELGFPYSRYAKGISGNFERRLGISAAQCALGFRVATLMLRIGVKEDSFESFILDVYNRCKDTGLSAQNIAFHLADLLVFSKTLPLSKIPDYIKEKTNEKGKLEDKIEDLQVLIENLQEEASDALSRRDKALQEEKMTSSELKWYTNIRQGLTKYGIPVDDISKLVKLVDNIRQYDYDVEKVINDFSDLERLRLERKNLQETILILENTNRNLQEQRAGNEVFVNKHKQLINIYNHLEAMKFGIKEMWFLRDTVMEIARENDIPPDQAVTKFLSDVELQYNNKLGFQSKIESLRGEVNRLRTELLFLPSVGSKLLKLTQSGVSEQDIINVAAVFEKYAIAKDRESFVSDLEYYGGVKSAIQELSMQYYKMRMEVSVFQTRNRNLNVDNQRLISSLVNSGHTFDFMSMSYSVGLQFEYLKKLESNGDEFADLDNVYRGEESVSHGTEKELIKPIENIENKHDVKNRLTGALSNARPH